MADSYSWNQPYIINASAAQTPTTPQAATPNPMPPMPLGGSELMISGQVGSTQPDSPTFGGTAPDGPATLLHPAEMLTRLAVPHEDTFTAQFGMASKAYYSRFDEALRNGWTDALAMRRDGFLHKLLRHRQIPVSILSWSLEPDDPENTEQARIASELTKIIEAIPRLQTMFLYLSEHLFYGKYGAQLEYGETKVDGIPRVTVTRHIPVNGDKFIYKWDGTPGVLVRRIIDIPEADRRFLENSDRGPTLYLYDEFYSDRFIIHQFEPADMDYTLEGEQAGAIHGLGFRGRLYWNWFFRTEIMSWMMDALQRIGVNGQLYGFYPTGNPAARDAMIAGIKSLSRDNVAVFEVSNTSNIDNIIHSIPPYTVAYEVLMQCIQYHEDIMTQAIIGQEHSISAEPTGIGAGSSDLQADVKAQIIQSDAQSLGETMTEQLVKRLVRMNRWTYNGQVTNDLPFNIRFKFQTKRENVLEKIQAAQVLHGMGVPLDMEDLRDEIGISAPKDGANVVPGENPNAPPSGEPQGGGPNGGIKAAPNGEPKKPPFGGPEQHNRHGRPERFGKSKDRTDDPGVMVCLKLPDHVAKEIATEPGVDWNELHITLAYLGRESELGDFGFAEATKAVARVADSFKPIRCTLGGIGRFLGTETSDNEDVIFVPVDSPELGEIRISLCDKLEANGVEYKRNHGFTPHVTLRGVGADEPTPDPIDFLDFNFNSLYLVKGDDWQQFRFDGVKIPDRYAAWVDKVHPRGQSENAGVFGEKPGIDAEPDSDSKKNDTTSHESGLGGRIADALKKFIGAGSTKVKQRPPITDRLKAYTDGDAKVAKLAAIPDRIKAENEQRMVKIDAIQDQILNSIDAEFEEKTKNPKDHKSISADYAKRRSGWKDEMNAMIREDTQDKQRIRDAVHEILKVDQPSEIKTSYLDKPYMDVFGMKFSLVDEKMRPDVEEVRSWMSSVTKRGDAALDLQFAAQDDRACYVDKSKTVAITPSSDKGVIAHEMGHAIEFRMSRDGVDVMGTVQDFLNHRCGSEKPLSMRKATGNKSYASHEVGRKDKFEKAFDVTSAYYCGKVYPNKSTEILSMGLEKLYNDPIGFASKDPEYCKFVIGVLDGGL